MKLKSFKVTNFQSVYASGDISTGDITCLVGKNEAGKTALLKALYKLNPISPGDAEYNFVDDYPRVDVADYEQDIKGGRTPPAEVVTAVFSLTDGEAKLVGQTFGPEFLLSTDFKLTKTYANHTGVELLTDEGKAAAYLSRALPEDIRVKAESCATPKQMLETVSSLSSDPAVAAIVPILQKCGDHDFAWYAYNTILFPLLPKFLYFDEYYQLRGCENIEQLQQRVSSNTLRPSDYPIVGLIELAGLTFEALLNPTRTQELKNRLEGAGNRLTKSILKYWSQNKHLQMRFDVRPGRPGDPDDMRSGTNIWGEVYDIRHWVSTGLGTRSRGFVWFFSFIAWYSQIQRRRDNVVLLLDEPGLTLHGRAQGDLLRYFEEVLKPAHQLIYTTHSPFMVNPERFEQVQIVQDRSIEEDDLPREEQGTKVLSDIFLASEDSLFPLQGALGYDIAQTLFVGKHTLLVEGPSDILYLQALSDALTRWGKAGLDPRWTLCPSGGIDKIQPFLSLFGGNRLHVAVLTDFGTGDRRKVDQLRRNAVLRAGHLFTAAEFAGKPEADIEDLFEPDLFVEIVNRAYQLPTAQALTVAEIEVSDTSTSRLIKKIEAAFRLRPDQPMFDHFTPAAWLIRNPATLNPQNEGSFKTLNRAAELFGVLSSLL